MNALHSLRDFANSLVTRLLLVGLLVLTLGTAVTYFQLTRFLRDDLTQVVSAQQLALAQYVARDVDQALENRRQFLSDLARRLPPALLTRPEDLSAWLAEHHALRPLFSGGLTVFATDGRALGDLSRPAVSDAAATESDAGFRQALAGQAVIGRPRYAPELAAPVLPIAVPVRDAAGRVAAVLVGRSKLTDRDLFDGLLQGRIGHAGGLLLISPQDKLFVAATDPRMVLRPTPAPGVNPLHDRAMGGFRGAGTTINAAGIEELSAIASVPGTGWFVVARMPVSEALATVARTRSFMFQQRVPVMLVVLGLIGFGALLLLRPLRRAAEQADGMARGELPLTPLPVGRADELGRLTAAFNRLLAKLDEQRGELVRQAHHDSLTGLPNRKLLADRLQQALARARRHGGRVAVLFLDLDGFKRINDSIGHEAGDEVLRQVAERLSAVVRETDTVARLGGDEFVLVAADFDGDGVICARALARKCTEAIGRPLLVRGSTHALGVSVGIALSNEGDHAEALLAAADRAMYAVKQRGSTGVRVAAPVA
ncbi:MAG: diguanylate cyclase [Pseudomonadota bacterium]